MVFHPRTMYIVALVYVSSITFIFNYFRLMDSPHSYIVNVHAITIASSSSISTPLIPIFLNLVFPFKWSKKELIGMFHDLLALLKECLPISTTSMVASNASFVHMPLLVVKGNQFNCGGDLLLYGSRVGGRFSFFDARSIFYERLCNS